MFEHAIPDGFPDGFEVHTRHSPATVAWEPIYARQIDGSFQLAILFGNAHANTRGGLHGGVIATLCDNAMGLTLSLSPGGTPKGFVTTALSIDYLDAAKPGQWVIVAPRLIKRGKASGTVDALVTANGTVIARSNASFRIAR